jgi:ArsR family transcriptional regulator
MKELARIYKALADETRLDIMALILHAGELCVCDCMAVLDITQSKASRHLRYLANAGLLEDRREGTWVYYQLAQVATANRLLVLQTLTKVLPGSRTQTLGARLESWLQEKARGDGGCGPLEREVSQ